MLQSMNMSSGLPWFFHNSLLGWLDTSYCINGDFLDVPKGNRYMQMEIWSNSKACGSWKGHGRPSFCCHHSINIIFTAEANIIKQTHTLQLTKQKA